ncbi:MAG: RsmB/NOP family class I SAM-dependent RNA methyltransferase [Minwuia sp.]|uniref:RsmB/NOP family class I SAM-dependent RNA methyltransferase n=1 Tax=Minwuia sp. TaxID=2493630 RepID=UPI003A8A0656
MRSGGRLAAAIDLLDLIDGEGLADLIVRDYFKTRRYAGSGDRRAVGDIVYGVFRQRGELDWRLAAVGFEAGNRFRALLHQMLSGAAIDWTDPHAPERPEDVEMELLASATAADMTDAPPAARLGYPVWLESEIEASFGSGRDAELAAALSGRAGTDLRVNTLKADRDSVVRELNTDGIGAAAHPLAPCGIRLDEPVRLEQHRHYAEGLIEIQDGGSQIAGHLLGARPGERIADICAGAGGKTLLLAADMRNEGEILASDIDGRRLKRLQERAARAGIGILRTEAFDAAAPLPDGLAGTMDRVLIDAPCSGTGTWRRQPEARWRLTEDRLRELNAVQTALLDRASELLRPGGRLLYVTCSFLRSENETVITDFLNRNPDYVVTPWREAAEAAGINLPLRCSDDDRFLRLSPLDHEVDSFFVAAVERRFR